MVAVDAVGMQLLAITDTGMFYTADGGTTFSAADVGLDARVSRLAILPDGTLLAGTDQGMFRASAPTGPWNPSGLGPAAIADLLVTQGHVIAATDLGVFASTDGAAWSFIPGLEGKFSSALAVDTAGRLLVGTTGNGLYLRRCHRSDVSDKPPVADRPSTSIAGRAIIATVGRTGLIAALPLIAACGRLDFAGGAVDRPGRAVPDRRLRSDGARGGRDADRVRARDVEGGWCGYRLDVRLRPGGLAASTQDTPLATSETGLIGARVERSGRSWSPR